MSDEKTGPYASCTDRCWKPVHCTICGTSKAPVGRSIPMACNGGYCVSDCPGYRDDPYPPHFWTKSEYEETVLGITEDES